MLCIIKKVYILCIICSTNSIKWLLCCLHSESHTCVHHHHHVSFSSLSFCTKKNKNLYSILQTFFLCLLPVTNTRGAVTYEIHRKLSPQPAFLLSRVVRSWCWSSLTLPGTSSCLTLRPPLALHATASQTVAPWSLRQSPSPLRESPRGLPI